MSINEVKASKWDKLIKYIKDSYDDEDADIWEFLGEELGIDADGSSNKEEDRWWYDCGVRYKSEAERDEFCEWLEVKDIDCGDAELLEEFREMKSREMKEWLKVKVKK